MLFSTLCGGQNNREHVYYVSLLHKNGAQLIGRRIYVKINVVLLS